MTEPEDGGEKPKRWKVTITMNPAPPSDEPLPFHRRPDLWPRPPLERPMLETPDEWWLP